MVLWNYKPETIHQVNPILLHSKMYLLIFKYYEV